MVTPPDVKVSARPAERNSVVLEVEIAPASVQASVAESVRHLGRRTKVPGFRPGKAPRALVERALGVRREDPAAPNPLYDDAKEHLFENSVLDAVRDQELDVLSIPEPEWLSFTEQDGAAYRVTLPLRPQVKLGAYTDYPFSIDVEQPDDAAVERVIEQLRDQQAPLVAVEERGAQKGDYAVIRFAGRRDGVPIEGAAADRMPLIIGNERLLPGFEDQLVGLREGDSKTFDITFPADYPEASLAGTPAQFEVGLLELREKRPPPADDDFARSLGEYADLDALRAEIRRRLERNSLDRARHTFADRVIEFAVANATVELPDILIERELEVMFDELRVRLAEQGISFDDYLRATERDESQLRTDFRPDAEKRVKTLLVLSEIAEKEGIDVADETLDAELARSRERYAGNQRLLAYLESPRGRAYTRSLLRRSQTVETLVDRWIEAHPEFSNVQHLHDDGTPSNQSDEKGKS
ncbi:MAG TPA: trigger factor [Candidatus Limnocylindria bacterium]|jgi:trigger factor|nr:trigger factor [Candidatus Limnocylindria bacterium]